MKYTVKVAFHVSAASPEDAAEAVGLALDGVQHTMLCHDYQPIAVIDNSAVIRVDQCVPLPEAK